MYCIFRHGVQLFLCDAIVGKTPNAEHQTLGTVEKYHNIHIVYTRQAETADQYIERLSFELRGRRRVRVATSDNLEQLIILGHGAERISAQHFHDEVYNAQAEIERILAQNNQKNNG